MWNLFTENKLLPGTRLQPCPSPSMRFLGKSQVLGSHCINSLIAKGRRTVFKCLSLECLCLPGPLQCLSMFLSITEWPSHFLSEAIHHGRSTWHSRAVCLMAHVLKSPPKTQQQGQAGHQELPPLRFHITSQEHEAEAQTFNTWAPRRRSKTKLSKALTFMIKYISSPSKYAPHTQRQHSAHPPLWRVYWNLNHLAFLWILYFVYIPCAYSC